MITLLQIQVKNNIRIRGASTPLRLAVTAALTKDNPEYVKAVKRRRPTWGLEAKLKLYLVSVGDIIAPRGFLAELEQILQAQGYNPAKIIAFNQTEGYPVDFGPWNEDFPIRPYQQPFIDAVVKNNGVGVAPAGAGKTIMGCRAIHDVGRPTLWITHTKDLMYQTKDRAQSTLKGVGEIGLLGDGVTQWGSGKLIIATVQTLAANPNLIETLDPVIGFIVVDEAHHFPADQFIETVGKFSAAKILGVTATTDRKDGLELYMYAGIGPVLYTIDRDILYENGSLLKPEIKFVFTDFNYEQASIREGDNVDAGGEDLDYLELMRTLINDRPRSELVADKILEYMSRGTGIVLAESIRYLYYIKDFVIQRAKLKGIKPPKIAVVHGPLQRYAWRVAKSEKESLNMVAAGQAVEHKFDKGARRWKVKVPQYSDIEFKAWSLTSKGRKELIDAVRNKEYDLLFATQLAREGLDIDHLTVEHMITPKRGDGSDTKDGSAVEQEIGRIQRPDFNNPSKAPILIDYVDYNVGVFQGQYYSRRKVYKRLGLVVPGKEKKPKDRERDIIEQFLDSIPM